MPEHIKKKLEQEIQVLEYELNHELPKELKKAVALGDLSENAEYHMAKQRQEFVRARLGQLKKRMAELPPEARKAMEPLLDEGPPVTATATGKTTTIAGYVANEWAIKGGPYTGSVWATDAIATPPAFQKWKSIEQGRGGMAGAGRRLGEAMQHVQGFPLRTRIETQTGGQTTILANEVLDVKEGTAPADVLKVPAGYTRQAQEG